VAFRGAGHFVVNVLRATQTGLSHRFATRGGDKFDGIAWEPGLGGAPVLRDMLATFECETASATEGGDHWLFIGRIGRIWHGDGEPLVFSAGDYCTTRSLHVATAQDDSRKVWGPPG
jgi:flavin reductase (DIM6/NTAB) family NADH-FMN oxidoreductase RutF